MIDPASFKNVRLLGGFVITEIRFTDAPMVDALGREAVALLGSSVASFGCFFKLD